VPLTGERAFSILRHGLPRVC